MRIYLLALIASFALFAVDIQAQEKPVGTLEVVAEMDVSPGNVAVSKEGRVFSSIHPFRATNLQLVEVTGNNAYLPFPNDQVQSTAKTKSDDKLDTPLGIVFDNRNRLWVLDVGLNIGKTRLFAYDIETRQELYRFDIPLDIAPSTSFVQDLVVDEDNGFVYLADVRCPGIIVVDMNKNTFRMISDLPSMKAEDIDIVIDDHVSMLRGNPARVSLDPITISEDRETLYFGAMNGTKWYQLPTKNIRDGEAHEELIKRISIVGAKPICDGAATDENGNHFFTNVQNYSIDVLSSDGKSSTLVKDPMLDWPDSARIHGDWLYIAANQIHKSPTFTGDKELRTAPFRVLRVKFK
ncbi:MAG: L-dopachrome tautomerase-related protein [Rubripirellula sp.]